MNNQLNFSNTNPNRTIVCMDGRIRPDGLDRPFIGLAGSGVLLTDMQIKMLQAKLIAAGIDPANITVTWHQHCGACEVYKKLHNDKRDADEIALWAAKRLAEGIGSKKKVVSIGWTEKYDYQVEADEHRHSEKEIVIDYTGKVDTDGTGLDNAFLLSHAFAPDLDWQKQELGIALNISFGPHGLGEKYFATNPMKIFLFGDNLDDKVSKINSVAKDSSNLIEIIKVNPTVSHSGPPVCQ